MAKTRTLRQPPSSAPARSQGMPVVEPAVYPIVAMSTAFRAQNFITAASFAKRLLQGNLAGVQKAQDVIAQV